MTEYREQFNNLNNTEITYINFDSILSIHYTKSEVLKVMIEFKGRANIIVLSDE